MKLFLFVAGVSENFQALPFEPWDEVCGGHGEGSQVDNCKITFGDFMGNLGEEGGLVAERLGGFDQPWSPHKVVFEDQYSHR